MKTTGAELLYSDVYTGMTIERPNLDALLASVRPRVTVMVTKLAHIARSVPQGISIIDRLGKDGMMDKTPTG